MAHLHADAEATEDIFSKYVPLDLEGTLRVKWDADAGAIRWTQ